MNTENKIKDFALIFEKKLNELTVCTDNDFKSVYDSLRYSLLSGGKRLRPYIMHEFYRLNGGIDDSYIDFAAALEMIHSYSLIHDDLPCMDNDDMRRGKPSCHAAFGESTALLAGDALLTLAFNTAAKTQNIPLERIVKSFSVLSDTAGVNGMIGGQIIDLESEKKSVSEDTVLKMYSKKTGELIKSAAVIGSILAGANEIKIKAAEKFALNLGIAFQICDDILDLTGDAATLGKPVGSDTKNDKTTYVSLVGIDNAKKAVNAYTQNAIDALSIYDGKEKNLIELANFLINRKF